MSIAGKFLSCTLGGVFLTGTHEWSVNETGDRLEATAAQHNGRGNKDVGVVDTKIRIRFYLDIATGQAGFLRAGTILTNLNLFTRSGAALPAYSIAVAKVFDSTIAGQIRDRFIVDADIEAAGDVVTYNEPN